MKGLHRAGLFCF